MASAEIADARARIGPGALTWMLPAQHEPLETLPSERLERFREHLGSCAKMAFDLVVEPEELFSVSAIGAEASH